MPGMSETIILTTLFLVSIYALDRKSEVKRLKEEVEYLRNELARKS